MTSSVDIVNRALAQISAKATIANLSEPSTEAIMANTLYASTRDAILRAAQWNFARKVAYLTLLKSAPGTVQNTSSATEWDAATMPAPPWLYEYAYPSDCLAVRYIMPKPRLAGVTTPPMFSISGYGVVNTMATPKARFEVASGTSGVDQINVINTNLDTALCCYTRRVENEGLWDDLFAEAMVQSLATQLAMPITGKTDVHDMCSRKALAALANARARDGNEGTESVNRTPDWLAVRGVGPDYGPLLNDGTLGYSDPSFLVS